MPTAPTPNEESEVEVIEAPLVRKRKLVKRVDVIAPEAESKHMADRCQILYIGPPLTYVCPIKYCIVDPLNLCLLGS